MVNIFEVIRKTTSRVEPVYSQYLADCMAADNQLMGEYWKQAVGDQLDTWPVPSRPVVEAEDVLKGGLRIDITIRDDEQKNLMGIEVKTADSSVEFRQLDKYLDRLQLKYPDHRVWMNYLTPFSAANKPETRYGRKAIEEFAKFNRQYSDSSHLSWLEVSKLPWREEDDLWRQMRTVIENDISKPPTPTAGWGRLSDDLGWETMQAFWDKLKSAEFEFGDDSVITLKRDDDSVILAEAVSALLTHQSVNDRVSGKVFVRPGMMEEFRAGEYGDFHDRLFRLAEDLPHVSIDGVKNYALRVRHPGKNRSAQRSMSICTSLDPNRIRIGRPNKPDPDNCSDL